jgi:acetyl esterase/lipase
MAEFHPELRRAARFVPRLTFSPGLLRVMRFVTGLRPVRKPPAVDGVTIRDVLVPRPDGTPVRLRLYMPARTATAVPVLFWIHGGGFIIGMPEQDEPGNIDIVRAVGIAVAAVSYRLAPEHPFPAAIEDCYAALTWLHREAETIGIKRDSIAIGGGSAGGGLAAGLVLMAHDRKEVPIRFQLLIYPMLDDRTTMRTDIDHAMLRLWTAGSNIFGWTAYLGRPPGGDGIDPYAAPARREVLAGLPPAWIGVGTCDLFHDEDLAYARRLTAAGVPCEVKIVDGAFHGFDYVGAKTAVAREFRRSYCDALRRAMFGTAPA